MKKIILSLTVVTFILTSAVAQSTVSNQASATKNAAPRETPEAKAKSAVTKLSSEIGLKPDQAASATKIFTDFFTKVQALRGQKSTLDEKAMQAKKKELKDARNTSLKAIMTSDQWTKFQEVLKKEHEDNKSKREGQQRGERQGK